MSDEDKTEEPTGRKLSKAREEGSVPQSQEIKYWASLLGVLIILSLMSKSISRDVVQMMLPFIDHPHAFIMEPEILGNVLVAQVKGFLLVMMLPLALVMILGIAANVSQVGLMWNAKAFAFDLSKLSPGGAFKKIFSGRNLVDFGKSVIKLVVIGYIIYLVIKARVGDFVALAAVDIFAMLAYLRSEAVRLTFIVLIIVTVLAGADYVYQRWAFMQKMKMSRQEIKDENKDVEGDPMIKSKLRSLRMQRARQRMMAAVPQADVVVTNPTHFAVALKYDMDAMSAPVLVAKGADLIALRIRELADENEVPIVENPPLARALFATVELDQEVPPEHYKAVAEVISYVMKLKGRLAN
ncbi:flagellar biosynthesis protein FlhB [Paramagnetospirillum kuznetsovii]|uniref:Flagellar biosynthetic protein FlhB n=1 Tax=Paramagnetospirillum kuznetsovii TaxID=2053833 RepID=A0A364NTH6_9PROT|nr:flagellar biosynthesis protein FlhB [Paramagnetospirillum kuznetsovii]RAU20187.1 flagellar biosynthesis protein FlhB [Paramagnetospirillum kuznetsovii]